MLSVLNVCGGHSGVQNETLSIHEDVTLIALDLFAGWRWPFRRAKC